MHSEHLFSAFIFYLIILCIYMHLYSMIYTTYCILLPLGISGRRVNSMNIDREFTVFEYDKGWMKRKRLQALGADEYTKIFATRM